MSEQGFDRSRPPLELLLPLVDRPGVYSAGLAVVFGPENCPPAAPRREVECPWEARARAAVAALEPPAPQPSACPACLGSRVNLSGTRCAACSLTCGRLTAFRGGLAPCTLSPGHSTGCLAQWGDYTPRKLPTCLFPWCGVDGRRCNDCAQAPVGA